MRREVCTGNSGERKGAQWVWFCELGTCHREGSTGLVLVGRRPGPCSRVHAGIPRLSFSSWAWSHWPLTPSLSWVGPWILGLFVPRPCFCSLGGGWNRSRLITPWRLLLGWTTRAQLTLSQQRTLSTFTVHCPTLGRIVCCGRSSSAPSLQVPWGRWPVFSTSMDSGSCGVITSLSWCLLGWNCTTSTLPEDPEAEQNGMALLRGGDVMCHCQRGTPAGVFSHILRDNGSEFENFS